MSIEKYSDGCYDYDVVQWTGDNTEEIKEFIAPNGYSYVIDGLPDNALIVRTARFDYVAHIGDYIMRDKEPRIHVEHARQFGEKYGQP